jgi:hypothetical protein
MSEVLLHSVRYPGPYCGPGGGGGGGALYERGNPVYGSQSASTGKIPFLGRTGGHISGMCKQFLFRPTKISQQGPPEASDAPAKFTSVACFALKGPCDGLPPLYLSLSTSREHGSAALQGRKHVYQRGGCLLKGEKAD